MKHGDISVWFFVAHASFLDLLDFCFDHSYHSTAITFPSPPAPLLIPDVQAYLSLSLSSLFLYFLFFLITSRITLHMAFNGDNVSNTADYLHRLPAPHSKTMHKGNPLTHGIHVSLSTSLLFDALCIGWNESEVHTYISYIDTYVRSTG